MSEVTATTEASQEEMVEALAVFPMEAASPAAEEEVPGLFRTVRVDFQQEDLQFLINVIGNQILKSPSKEIA